MVFKFEKETSGVLLLCSQKGLKNISRIKSSTVIFHQGVLPLVNAGMLITLATSPLDAY